MTPVACQICHRYQRHRWQILPPVSVVLLIPVANLPPVSTIPVANCHRYQQWDYYQAEDTLKWTWKQKFRYMLTLLSKGVPTKLLKFFWLKIFWNFRTEPSSLNIKNYFRQLKGAQAWEFFARVFCTKRTHLGMWVGDWGKKSNFLSIDPWFWWFLVFCRILSMR